MISRQDINFASDRVRDWCSEMYQIKQIYAAIVAAFTAEHSFHTTRINSVVGTIGMASAVASSDL